MVKAVIFDFDGTIADTLSLVIQLGRELAERRNIELPPELKNKSLEEIKLMDKEALLATLKIPKLKVPLIVNEMRKKGEERIYEIEPFPGVRKLIVELSSEYKLGVLSSNSSSAIRSFLEHHNLLEYFDEIVGGIHIFGKKGKLKKLVKRMAISPSEAIYVADGEEDVDACRSDNIRMIAVSWGYNDKSVLEGKRPDFIVENPDEVRKVLENLK